MRENRAEFVEFFGGDELVLPPAEATGRLNAYYRQHQEAALARRTGQRRPRNLPGLDVPAFELPRGLAAAHPDTANAVFRKILRQRDFTWAEHGEALMRRRKAWYYQRAPRPGVSVIGARLAELTLGDRR